MKTDFDQAIHDACQIYLPGLDWRLHKAQLFCESGLNPKAVSPAGAGGIAQFMQVTWDRISENAGYKGRDRFDPAAAIPCSAFYMAELWQKWFSPRPVVDRYCLALASYNAGIGNMIQAQKARNMPELYCDIIQGLPLITKEKAVETQQYVRRILTAYTDIVLGTSQS